MNSSEIFEKITKRNKYVVMCGGSRNTTYLEYLKSSKKYDSLKKAFYTAVDLARLDQNVPENKLQHYEHIVKHYDMQLLSQLKDRNYEVNEISLEKAVDGNKEDVNCDDTVSVDIEIEEDKEKNPFIGRISKIERAGYLRNRFHFEFNDNKMEFEKAKKLFHNETLLAVQDGLITEIDQEIHRQSLKKVENELDVELSEFRRSFNNKRQEVRVSGGVERGGVRGRGNGYSRGRQHGGSRGRGGHGRHDFSGPNIRDRFHGNRGSRWNGRINKH